MTSINPKSGSASGGYPVLIYAQNLTGKEIAVFGKRPCIPVSIVRNATNPYILCFAPPGKPGEAVEVYITNDGLKKVFPIKFLYTEGKLLTG
jgi:hypothetical protein